MKIVLCGSMSFAKELHEAGQFLIKKGHKVILPRHMEEFVKGRLDYKLSSLSKKESAEIKKRNCLIRDYFQEIRTCF